MKISIDELTLQPSRIRKDLPVGAYGEEIILLEPVRIRVNLQKSGEKVYVHGSVETAVELTCCRCLERFSYGIDTDIDLVYQPAEHSEEQNEQLGRDDLKTIKYSEPVLDLDDDARQAIHLAVPFKPLCRDGCQGLCPGCGRNLNSGSCGCMDRALNSQFAELKKLLPRISRGSNEERSREDGES